MPTAVLKLFAGQSTRRMDEKTDGQSSDYMIPPLESIINCVYLMYKWNVQRNKSLCRVLEVNLKSAVCLCQQFICDALPQVS